MKKIIAFLGLSLCSFLGTQLQAQTLNWGNVILDPVTDSTGADVTNAFVFELGSFASGFTPAASNTDQWLSNWQVFDSATYDPLFGFSTATAYIQNGVTSNNPNASPESFAGLDAYIWVRKGDTPVEGSEWLVTRANDWTFPLTGGSCCDTELLEWSSSDLTPSNTPLWGRQNEIEGPGVYTSTGTEGLQTYTFVPEPTSAMLVAMAGTVFALRRRRTA